MKYTAPIRRVETAKGHHYVDAAKTRVPGSTTIIDGGLPQKALINWSGSATAAYAIDNWDALADLSPAARLKELEGGRYKSVDKAKKLGTRVHEYAEHLIRGEPVEVEDFLRGHVESYARFLDRFKVEPVEVEFGVASYEHGYAGTADMVAWFTTKKWGRRLLLADVKTGRTGIYGSTSLQLASYRYADVILGQCEQPERPMVEVEGCAGIHVRGDGADLMPITADQAQFRTFLYAKQIYEFDKVSRDLVGLPLESDATSLLRLVEDDA